MRLPLGILSGIGFIGAGAIIKKDSAVIGVTTAATLWFATMLGLLFGSGLLKLGCVAAVLALVILEALRHVEDFVPRGHRGELTLALGEGAPAENEIVKRIRGFSPHIHGLAVRYVDGSDLVSLRCEVKWTASGKESPETPDKLAELRRLPGVVGFSWEEQD